jgi:hypothetical protein
MKQKRYFIGLVMTLFASAFLLTCEEEETPDCMTCHLIEYDADSNILDTIETNEYCGEELDEVLSEEPVTIDSITTEWSCY